MNEDSEQKEDPLASIRHLLPDIKSEDSWLGENYRGWQSFANAIKVASAEYDCEIVCRPEQGFLRVDCFFAPPHIKTLGYAIEAATNQICQRCGEHPASKEIRDGWGWKLCQRCVKKSKSGRFLRPRDVTLRPFSEG